MSPEVAPSAATNDTALLAAVRAGDESAFAALVGRHHGRLLRMARMHVRDAGVAEEVAQEAWVAFVEGLDRFEGRASVGTWLCGIAINLARNRWRREARTVPVSSLGPEDGPLLPEDRFRAAGSLFAGNWAAPPTAWPDDPERHVLSGELRRRLEGAIATLPDTQREVLVLRDVEGLSAEEVCNALGLSDTNQRVLLHRARTRLRALLETHYDGKST